MGAGRGRPPGGGVDRITALPDELLHAILALLPSTAEAARTSVLSRRWRRVWTRVPALTFPLQVGPSQPRGPRVQTGIDAALAALAAPALDRLAISVDDLAAGVAVPALLRFASARVAGELRLTVRPTLNAWPSAWQQLELPVCERATAVHLQVPAPLRFAAVGTFAALRALRIVECAGLRLGDLERAVSTQCPRLRELTLSLYDTVSLRDLGRAVSIRSDTLERLKLAGTVTAGVAVDAPRLALLEISRRSVPQPEVRHGVHVAAPELTEVVWHGVYDPRRDGIVRAGRHLRRLEVTPDCSYQCVDLAQRTTSALLHLFDTVDELIMTGENLGYKVFMSLAKLPRCKVFKLRLHQGCDHGFATSILDLLRKCTGIKRFNLSLSQVSYWNREHRELTFAQMMTNSGSIAALDSLEEAEFRFARVRDTEVDLLRLLLTICCRAAPRRVAVHATHETECVAWRRYGAPCLSRSSCEAIAGLCRPETSVEFFRYWHGKYVRYWTGSGGSSQQDEATE
ncbi:hypothetical protein ACP4OV_007360 [Aristida adscensionis]